MNSKSDFVLETTKKLVDKASDFGLELVVCGGISVHMLSKYLKRDSPRQWNHKDIDFVVPLSQLSRAIAFFKSLGYTKVFVPHKKARVAKNHFRFGNIINNVKILVDIYGKPKMAIVRINQNGIEIPLLSPRIELENWRDRERRVGPRPSIRLSIDFLQSVVERKLFEEEELT